MPPSMDYAIADEALLEVAIDDEERSMWRTFLDRGDFPNAFRHCRSQVWVLRLQMSL